MVLGVVGTWLPGIAPGMDVVFGPIVISIDGPAGDGVPELARFSPTPAA